MIRMSFGKREQGFSLLMIVLIFVVIAAAGVGAAFFAAKIKTIGAERRTIGNMQAVRDAMQKYYRGHHDLPNPAGTSGDEVPTGDLNLKPSFGKDAWGQPLYYYRLTDNSTGTTRTDIRGVQVEGGPLVAGVLISRGTDQTSNFTRTLGPPTQFTTTVNDVALPVDVQAEAIEIATEALQSLAKKVCSYTCRAADATHPLGHPITADGYLPVVDGIITDFALGRAAYDYDPWLRRYEWLATPKQFRSFGPIWDPNPAVTTDDADDLYVPGVMNLPCCTPSPGPTPLTELEDFQVFAGAGASFGPGATTDAATGSNVSVNLEHNSNLADIQTGGSADVAHGTTVGNILACGAVTIDGTVEGEVHTQTTVVVDSNGLVKGNIFAKGNVTINGEALGNVDSGGNVVVDKAPGAGHVKGNVVAHGTITLTGGATIDGTQTQHGTPANPIDCVPSVKFPCPATFTPSNVPAGDRTVPQNGSLNLVPGTYRDLTINKNGVLTLSTGAVPYVFKSISAGQNPTIQLNLSGAGLLTIFVEGNVTFPQNLTIKVWNGTAYVAFNDATILKSEAAKVYMELHGALAMTQGGSWFGTIYSIGAIDIQQNFTGVGAIYSRDAVTVPQNFVLDFQASTYAINNWSYLDACQ